MRTSTEPKFPKFKYILLCFCLIGLVFILKQEGFAGGIDIHMDDLRLNGYLPGSSFQAGQDITITYTATDYSFSGGGNENEYYVFVLSHKLPSIQSVGSGGQNRPNDVKAIQQRLQELDLFDSDVDGECDSDLIHAIKAFQKTIGFTQPDGRVDPGGTTLRKLFAKSEPEIFVQHARSYLSSKHTELKFNTIFTAPKQLGKYEIKYCQIPLFTHYGLGSLVHIGDTTKVILNETDTAHVRRHIQQYQGDIYFASLGTINIVDEKSPASPAPTVYLRVNGEVPGRDLLIPSGVSEKPIRFSWWVEKTSSSKDLMYRYQLYPDDSEWSSWQTAKEILYYYINHGHHEFRLETKYHDESGEGKRTPQVNYSFTLDAPFISKPVSKTVGQVGDTDNAEPIPANLYSGSKAILIGVTQYEDGNFTTLPYVKEDLRVLQEELEQNGFDVTTIEGNVTREQIFTAIDKLVSSAHEGDRIVIYFSAHGFQDEYSPTDGYVATSNCDTENPDANCISLGYLRRTVKKFLNKPVKHILLVVDSCFSGLGVLTKKTGYPEIAKIAIKDGAHMMTAGMAAQEAEMDHELKMSTFTHFLTKGLEGKADYTNDGIVTLTELHLFVQYEVANKTGGTQIPMIGRISGEGEIIFDNR